MIKWAVCVRRGAGGESRLLGRETWGNEAALRGDCAKFVPMNPTPLETTGWTAGDRLQIIAGPCAVEGESVVMETAEALVKWCSDLALPLIFKGSYRKANRSRSDSFTGIGDEKALRILRKVRETFGVPVITDIHAASEAAFAA